MGRHVSIRTGGRTELVRIHFHVYTHWRRRAVAAEEAVEGVQMAQQMTTQNHQTIASCQMQIWLPEQRGAHKASQRLNND